MDSKHNRSYFTIVVASGKGGVGKSTVSAILAKCLAEHGQNVTLLDADIQGPNLYQILPSKHDRLTLVSIDDFVEVGQPLAMRGPATSSLLQKLLQRAESIECNYLIIDTPPGTGDVLLSLLEKQVVTGVLLVTTSHHAALANNTKLINAIKQFQIPMIGTVHNMAYSTCASCGAESEEISPAFSSWIKEHNCTIIDRLPRLADESILPDGSRIADYILKHIDNYHWTPPIINIHP